MKTTQEIIDMLVEKLGEEDFLELNDYLCGGDSLEASEALDDFVQAVSDKACDFDYSDYSAPQDDI